MSRDHVPASDVLTVEFDRHVATLWLDRPDARNAFAPDFWTQFPAIVETLGADPETRVIVIAAKGASFTVGIDLKAFGPMLMSGDFDPGSPNAATSEVGRRMHLYRTIERMQRTFTSIADCPKPVIAAVHGYCIGAGVDLVTACDIRYASEDASFSVRETKLAMVADVGTLQRLPDIVDPGSLAEMVYTGRDYTAREVHEMGLVTRVYPDADAVREGALAVAREIAANSPLAVQGSKSILHAGTGSRVAESLDRVALWNSAFLTSDDLTEAMVSFLEKRPPEFTGE